MRNFDIPEPHSLLIHMSDLIPCRLFFVVTVAIKMMLHLFSIITYSIDHANSLD
jgi:hypothetical protein